MTRVNFKMKFNMENKSISMNTRFRKMKGVTVTEYSIYTLLRTQFAYSQPLTKNILTSLYAD